MPIQQKRTLVEREHPDLSVSRQCDLLGLSRSSLYYEAEPLDELSLALMRLIDEQYLETPFYGSRRMRESLREKGYEVNRKRVQALMRVMGIEAIYPKKCLSLRNPAHKIYPYLLRGLEIDHVNHVWSTDITYIRLRQGFVYLVAVMDWFSRYVLSWRLSTALGTSFCLEALEEALTVASPEIFNTDQGSQFTSNEFTQALRSRNILVSMDSRGRALDNVFIERLWRSMKYEEVYQNEYRDVTHARERIKNYLEFYNKKRLHQSLDYKTPMVVYRTNANLGTKRITLH